LERTYDGIRDLFRGFDLQMAVGSNADRDGIP